MSRKGPWLVAVLEGYRGRLATGWGLVPVAGQGRLVGRELLDDGDELTLRWPIVRKNEVVGVAAGWLGDKFQRVDGRECDVLLLE